MHEEARQQVVGPSSKLWETSPGLALTLLTTIPSGDLGVVAAREGISRNLCGPGFGVPLLTLRFDPAPHTTA